MKRIFNFFYKISTIVFMIIGIILLTIVATIVGLWISYGNPEGIRGLLEKIGFSGTGLDEVMKTIEPLLQGVHWNTQDLSTLGIVLICIFSVSVGLLGMFVVFGIFSASYRIRIRKEVKQARKASKNQINDQVSVQPNESKKAAKKAAKKAVEKIKQPEEPIPASAYAYYSY